PERALAVIVGDVGSADPGRGDFDEHLLGANLRHGALLEPHLLFLVEDLRLHRGGNRHAFVLLLSAEMSLGRENSTAFAWTRAVATRVRPARRAAAASSSRSPERILRSRRADPQEPRLHRSKGSNAGREAACDHVGSKRSIPSMATDARVSFVASAREMACPFCSRKAARWARRARPA